MDKTIDSCNWEKIEEFSSFHEYEGFSAWLGQQVKSGTVEEVPVQKPYAVFGVQERWFRCIESSEIWRLVAPDAPFKGCWETV